MLDSSRPNPFALGAAVGAAVVLGIALTPRVATGHDRALPSSAGDLAPPPIEILTSRPGATPGLIFVAPKGPLSFTGPDGQPRPLGEQGPEIVDDRGRPVWFHALADGDQAADFRVQRYRDEPVLTWSQGQGIGGVPTVPTVNYIVDSAYRVVARVRAGNGLNADQHEFKLTAHGTALLVVYQPVPFDLSPFGGPKEGSVVDGIVQEVDVATGRVLFEWHSVGHVEIGESKVPVPASTETRPYDYFHINAVSLDEDRNYVVSARNTSALYALDRRTGAVRWRLGGTRSDFTLGAGVPFAWQHDPEPVGDDTIRIFDNEAGPTVLPHSRVIWVHLDARARLATLARSLEHPDGLSAPSQGNSQALPHGHTFVGWGATGRFSELDHAGVLLLDGRTPSGYDTYRAYRHSWHARPETPPVATARRNPDGTVTVHAIWNGATEVERWLVVAGDDPHHLWPAGSAPWSGLDTTLTVGTDASLLAVVARDEEGHFIGRSRPVPVDAE